MNETVAKDANQSDVCSRVLSPLDHREPHIAYIYIYGFSALILVGIPANILSFFVLQQDRPYSTTRTLLLFLTVADLLILLVNLVLYPLKTAYDVYNIKYLVWAAAGDPQFYALANMAKCGQIWITVLISADRFFATCHPSIAVKIRTIRNVKMAVLLISIVSVLVNIPRLFSYYREPVDCFDRTVYQSILNHYCVGFKIVYEAFLDPVIYFCVPVAALLVFNTLLAINVKKAKLTRETREHMNVRMKHERVLTIILIAVVSVFIICETPTLVLLLLDLCNRINLERPDKVLQFCSAALEKDTLVCFSIFLLLINSSTNFFLYVFIGEKFRSLLFKSVCSMKKSTFH